jgi:hypothetical protein
MTNHKPHSVLSGWRFRALLLELFNADAVILIQNYLKSISNPHYNETGRYIGLPNHFLRLIHPMAIMRS